MFMYLYIIIIPTLTHKYMHSITFILLKTISFSTSSKMLYITTWIMLVKDKAIMFMYRVIGENSYTLYLVPGLSRSTTYSLTSFCSYELIITLQNTWKILEHRNIAYVIWNSYITGLCSRFASYFFLKSQSSFVQLFYYSKVWRILMSKIKWKIILSLHKIGLIVR